MEANLTVRPDKRSDFDSLRGLVGFKADDIGESATLRFEGGRLTCRGGLASDPMLTISSDTGTILELSNLRIGPLGLPVYVDSVGRSIVSKLLRRQLRIEGLVRHPAAVNRLTRIFSVR